MAAVQELLRRARSDALGRIYHFRARLPKDLPSYDRYIAELGRYKGGIFFEMAGHVIDMMVAILGRPNSVTPFLAHHHAKPGAFIDNGVAVFGFDHAWGIIEVPALEVAPHARRVEVYGTTGACVIGHLGSGHLANKDIQPIETYQAGAKDWQTHNLPAATLQIADLREFAAVVSRRKKPDFSLQHDLNVQEAVLRASAMI
jgi:predicted dehydrogenase